MVVPIFVSLFLCVCVVIGDTFGGGGARWFHVIVIPQEVLLDLVHADFRKKERHFQGHLVAKGSSRSGSAYGQFSFLVL